MNAAATLVTKAMAVALGSALTTGGLSAAGHTTSLTLYTPEPLGTQATYAVSNIYASAPAGAVSFGGIPFTVANTAWAGSGQQYSVPINASRPLNVYILLNSSNATLGYKGQAVGRVHLTFSDGSSQDTNLVAGGEIREWWSGSGSLVDTLTDPSTSTVWQGQAQAAMGVSGPAHIDMLNVKIGSTSANLTGVSIVNTAAAPYWMFASGVTVAYRAALTGGGNTGGKGDGGTNNDDNKDVNHVNPPTIKPGTGKSDETEKTDVKAAAKPTPAATPKPEATPKPAATPKPIVAKNPIGHQTDHESRGAATNRSDD